MIPVPRETLEHIAALAPKTEKPATSINREAAQLSLSDLEAVDPGSPMRRQRRFLCPLPACRDHQDPRRHRSFSLDSETGAYYCFRCQGKGLLTDFWRPLPPRSREQRTRAQLTKAFSLSPPKQEQPEPVPLRYSPEQLEASLARYALDGPGAEYVLSRGIPLEIAERAGVRYAPHFRADNGTWPAVLFPVRDQAGQLVAVHARRVDGDDKRTIGNKKLGVFEIPQQDPWDPITLVEGPFDALALAAVYVPSIALIGISWPEWLPARCRSERVFLATDADEAGDEAAHALARDLRLQLAEPLRLRPGFKDWNETLLRAGAQSLRDTLIDALYRFAPPVEVADQLLIEDSPASASPSAPAPASSRPACVYADHTEVWLNDADQPVCAVCHPRPVAPGNGRTQR